MSNQYSELIAALRDLPPGETLIAAAAWISEETLAKMYLAFSEAGIQVKISHDHGSHELRFRRLS